MQPQFTVPAIVFEPDGYRTDGQRLMGRQAAGNGFLRAVVQASAGRPVVGYTPTKGSAEAFTRMVKEMDSAAQPQWLSPARADLLAQLGHLYLPGPNLGDMARRRLRAGPAAWSLTGITHTTASHGAMDAVAGMLEAPVMPWDALVCTSSAVLSTVKTVLQAQAEYLRWRLGAQLKLTLPQLPVIPLGVHCEDFQLTPGRRLQAREALGIAQDEVVALFVGRLSFHAKAHPHAMYTGLQGAARGTGRKLVLNQCGWFANAAIERAFKDGAASACPDVRCIYTDGRDAAQLDLAWASADVFVSLSDNIQETFGLTPVEAMAAGLPVVVTDWDGYKDTVRDGVDGFRIPTWIAPPGAGSRYAVAHEADLMSYDQYCGLSCQHVAVDLVALSARLSDLVVSEELRRKMGEAARRRAREVFDWRVVYGRYQQLWSALSGLRAQGQQAGSAAPRSAPGRLDPFVAFTHYGSRTLNADTLVALAPGATVEGFVALARSPLFSYGGAVLPDAGSVGRLRTRLLERRVPAAALWRMEGGDWEVFSGWLVLLAKAGWLTLAPAEAERPSAEAE